MAAYIPVTNVAEVVVYGLLAQQQTAMVLNFLYPSAITPTNLAAIAEGSVTLWEDHLAALFSTAMHVTSGKATDLTTQDAGTAQYFPPTDIAGTQAAASVANNAAYVISHHTALRGRSYRGRTYLCGMPTTALADSAVVTSTYHTAVLADWAAYIDGLEALGGNFVIVSRRNNNAPRVTGAATPVISYSADLDLDSQRRRLAGRGA